MTSAEAKKKAEVRQREMKNKLALQIDEVSDDFNFQGKVASTSTDVKDVAESGSVAKSSFANFFSKRPELLDDNENKSKSGTGTGERPWYYFDGNTTEKSKSKLASDEKKEAITNNEREGGQVVDLYSNSNINTPVLLH